MTFRAAAGFAGLVPVVVMAFGLLHCGEDTSGPGSANVDAGTTPDAPATDGAACASPTGPGTTHDKNIEADETWTAAGSPHIIPATIDVRNGATLTIEPCAEVRLAKGASLNVANVPAGTTGTLKAEGTAVSPITFTGESSERWGAVFVRVPEGKAALRHVKMEGGGGDLETMHASLFVRGPGEWPSRRDVLVDHVEIKGSLGYGAVVDHAAAFAEGSTDLVVEGAGNGDPDRSFPLRIGEGALHTLPSGKYTGNATDEILIYEDAVLPGSGLREDATMHDRGVPYRIGQGTNKTMRVEEATLTIEPGVTLAFEPGASFVVHHQNEDVDAKAALVAVGTAEKPIVFTSASPTPAPGAWVGLYFGGRALGTNRLDHVRIEWAGGDCLCAGSTCSEVQGNHDSAIFFPRQPASGVAITNTTFANIDGHGVHRAWQGNSSQSFLATNTFTSVTGCKETLPVPLDGVCPDPKPTCP